MNLPPRISRFALASLLAVALAPTDLLLAQERAAPPAPPRPKPSATPKQNPKGKRDPKARARREQQLALAALLEAAEAARTLEQPLDKVEVLAEAADALWPFDEQTARSMLRRAWEVTTAPGAVEAFKPEEDESETGARELIYIARQHVITLAARHDTRLAESYMREFTRGQDDAGEEAADSAPADNAARSTRGGWRQPSPQSLRRLWTAHALVSQGAYRNAAAIVAPAVNEGVNRPLLDFILRLRAFDPREADALYLRLLERTRADAEADANDVLLLSTPIVSPELYASIGADGATNFATVMRRDDGAQAEEPSAPPLRLRRAFFDTAAAVLLRLTPFGGAAESARGAATASYFAIGRLLPFFDREAPQYAPELRARMAALVHELDEARRNALSEQMRTRTLKSKNSTDPLRPALERLQDVSDERERERLRFEAVAVAAERKFWDRARQLAGEIGDAELRRAAFTLIAVQQLKSLAEAFKDEEAVDDFERAAAFTRAADAPQAARAIGLAQAAELAARKGKSVRASQLFDEAVSIAGQSKDEGGSRVALRIVLAQTAARLFVPRAWEMLSELTAALNEVEGVTEGGGCYGIAVDIPDGFYCVDLAEPTPEPELVFDILARLDVARALAEARALKDNATRARFVVASARAALEKSAKERAGAAR